MPALVRTLLVWLMVLAIPNQGLAASVMQHCAPAGPRPPTAAVVAPSMDRHDHVHSEQRAGQDVAQTVQRSARHGAGGVDHAQGQAAEGAGTCSVCAACCHAIGMPPSLNAILQAPGASRVLQTSVMGVESFVPGGLDRPPRMPQA